MHGDNSLDEVEGVYEPEVIVSTKESGPSRHHRTIAHMNSQRPRQGLHKSELNGVLELSGKIDTCPHP